MTYISKYLAFFYSLNWKLHFFIFENGQVFIIYVPFYKNLSQNQSVPRKDILNIIL